MLHYLTQRVASLLGFALIAITTGDTGFRRQGSSPRIAGLKECQGFIGFTHLQQQPRQVVPAFDKRRVFRDRFAILFFGLVGLAKMFVYPSATVMDKGSLGSDCCQASSNAWASSNLESAVNPLA